MSGVAKSLDLEPDVDVQLDHGPANECAMCHIRVGPMKWGLCWSEADGYFEGWRCADVHACRARRAESLPPSDEQEPPHD
jgi:hypothetical protein